MEFEFSGEVIEWRGPAPYHFVALPDGSADLISSLQHALSYGWGCIPVSGQIGGTAFTTSLFPRHGGYLVPIKDAVRRAEGIVLGDRITLTVTTREPRD